VLEVTAPGVLGNDFDADGDTLTAIIQSYPSSGDLQFGADGSFTYIPAANFNGQVSFTYVASDGSGNPSDPATVVITVGAVNTAPVAQDDLYMVFEDQTTTVPAPGILANDFDYDDTVLTATLVTGPSHGTLVLETSGTFVYTPNPNFTGEDRFLYQASDGVNLSNVAVVTLVVQPVNDIPLVNADYYSTDEGKVLEVAAPGV